MPGSIHYDATLADVVASLVGPEAYVRKVLERLYQYKDSNPSVKIGVSGKGPYPRYRIVCTLPDGRESVLGAFNDNGTQVTTSESTGDSWSVKSSTIEEVKELLGKVRKHHK
jgi:hypothetical protein